MRRLASIVAALFLSVASGIAHGPVHPPADAPAQVRVPPAEPKRIISLIPPVTEMLFAMGAGPQVVAVSSFDNYPPEVAQLQRVGALLDPDVERILSLRPDLVIIYESQTDLRKQLERAHIPTYVYSHAGLADVTTTMSDVGARVGHAAAAAQVAREIDRKISSVRQRVAALPRIPTLLVFEREAHTLRGIYASGGVGFIHDMVEAAGGANVFADVRRQAVQATTELILARRPDIIIELRSSVVTDADRRRELATWRTLGTVPAVRTGRVFLFADQRMSIAGPRVGEVVEVFGRTIHPEAFAR